MEEAFDSGKVKAIGVSNFNHLQIERVMKMARIKPVSQQVSWSELGHAITIISTPIKLKKGLFCAYKPEFLQVSWYQIKPDIPQFFSQSCI